MSQDQQEKGVGKGLLRGVTVALILSVTGAASGQEEAPASSNEATNIPRAFGTGSLVSEMVKTQPAAAGRKAAPAVAQSPDVAEPTSQVSASRGNTADGNIPRAFGTGKLVSKVVEIDPNRGKATAAATAPEQDAPESDSESVEVSEVAQDVATEASVTSPDMASGTESSESSDIATDEASSQVAAGFAEVSPNDGSTASAGDPADIAEDETPGIPADGYPVTDAAASADASADWETEQSASEPAADSENIASQQTPSEAAAVGEAEASERMAAGPAEETVSQASDATVAEPAEQDPRPTVSAPAEKPVARASPPKEDLSAPPVRPVPPPVTEMFDSWWLTDKESGFKVEFVGLPSGQPGIVIRFSEALGSPDSVESHISLVGPNQKEVDGQWTRSTASNVIYWLDLEPGRYSLKISGDVSSAGGEALGETVQGVVRVIP